MMHATFNMQSLERFILKMTDDMRGVDIDAAAVEALDTIGDMMLDDMQAKVAKHRDTGAAYDAVKKNDVVSQGNQHSVEVGAMDIRGEDKDGFHVIYQEYGSPTLPADPWMRPASG